jgi:integrase
VSTSFDVRIWKLRARKRAKGTTYSQPWVVGPREHYRNYATKALGESFRASLITAARNGEAFDVDSGLPLSMLREQGNTTWYEVAVMFCDTKWKRWAPRTRKSAAEALATVTAILIEGRGGPDQRERRHALEHWTFNTSTRENDEAPEGSALTVAWLREHSIPLARLADPAMVRLALDGLSSKLDGSPAAATTANRKRMVFHQALEFAVERGLIDANPLDRVKWKKPRTAEAIDRRSVVNPTQARALLRAVSEIDDTLTLFFALMYFAALRPAEAAALRIEDCELPADGWGMLHLARSIPRIQAAWVDSGDPHESRSLKHRAPEEVRPVPACPELVAHIRRHSATHGTARDGRLLSGPRGDRLSESTCGRVLTRARTAALSTRDAASPLVRRPYDLRHAAVSTWLNAGVPPTLVAEWAGHSVQVLLRVYAKCIEGQDVQGRRLIDGALGEPDPDPMKDVERDE